MEVDDTASKLYIIVGLMPKETVRSSKLRILPPFLGGHPPL